MSHDTLTLLTTLSRATLLLAHARTQIVNQHRLENYLAASSRPNLDISSRIQTSQIHRYPQRGVSPNKGSGTDTPRDLNARVKILELYTLHVLLRNNEWDYAREFIGMSEVLDEERREAFLQALQSLQDEHSEVINREREVQKRQEEQSQGDIEETRQRRSEMEDLGKHQCVQDRPSSIKASSEVDYGIDSSHPNGSTRARSPKGISKKARSTGSTVSHVARPSVSDKKVVASQGPFRGALVIIANIRKLLETVTATFKGNPMTLLRTLAFILAFLLILSRSDIRNRVKRVIGKGWDKIRATAGMGVKVSYI
jgi:hypothetical protein